MSMFIHFIMSFHLLCLHDTHFVHMHAIGAREGVMLLEFELGNPKEQQGEPQEVQPQETVGEEDPT
jgi:hypothetical protein